jgi:hypothetical protein
MPPLQLVSLARALVSISGLAVLVVGALYAIGVLDLATSVRHEGYDATAVVPGVPLQQFLTRGLSLLFAPATLTAAALLTVVIVGLDWFVSRKMVDDFPRQMQRKSKALKDALAALQEISPTADRGEPERIIQEADKLIEEITPNYRTLPSSRLDELQMKMREGRDAIKDRTTKEKLRSNEALKRLRSTRHWPRPGLRGSLPLVILLELTALTVVLCGPPVAVLPLSILMVAVLVLPVVVQSVPPQQTPIAALVLLVVLSAPVSTALFDPRPLPRVRLFLANGHEMVGRVLVAPDAGGGSWFVGENDAGKRITVVSGGDVSRATIRSVPRSKTVTSLIGIRQDRN